MSRNKDIRGAFSPPANLILYYDETNNIRKLTIRTEGNRSFLNNELHEFILGGIAIERGATPNYDKLLKQCVLLKTKDVKSKSFFKHDDFIKCIESKRVTFLLNWLVEENILIHYFRQDNLYFALTGLMDSLLIHLEDDPYNTPGVVTEIKNGFYDFVMENLPVFLSFFNKYSYPNVKRRNVGAFCVELLEIIHQYAKDSESFSLGYIKNFLKHTIEGDLDLEGIHYGKGGTLSEDFEVAYLYRMTKTTSCTHIFDWESNVIKFFKGMNVPYDYKFVHSEDERLIQLSDVVVKLISKYLEYVKSVNYKIPYDKMNKISIKNFKLLDLLIDRSNYKSTYLLEAMGPMRQVKNSYLALNHLFLLDEVLSLEEGTKSISDFEIMKEKNCHPFNNAQECFIMTIEDYYIAKTNGKERLLYMLKDWDKDAQKHIMDIVITRMLD